MRRLFPGVPANHPAMSAMILNIASNMLGLANAATPFGIKAIEELDKLNGRKGTATNAMVLFLAINTAGLAILPSGVVALRASLGSQNAVGDLLPDLVRQRLRDDRGRERGDVAVAAAALPRHPNRRL